MTLGEKIREARRKCGFSQEQLAEKMSVSRSAVAKWETDKGLPDVGNLRILARLLNVSIDHLLDEGQAADAAVIRERYDLEAYGYGCSRVKKDRMVLEKYPDAAVYPLLARQDPACTELPAESGSACRAGAADRFRQTDRSFYLLEKEGRRFLVTVTDTFVETRPLEQPPESSFTLDGWSFIKFPYELRKEPPEPA